MKVAVTSQGPELSSQVDPRFGRARYFVVVDTDSSEFTAHDNAKNMDAVQGAGIQAARTVVELGVAAVVTGHVGPKAFGALHTGGIRVYPNASATVKDAVEAFKAGRLQLAEHADVEGHWA
jgi:predicted Fe-Mo cluster-binding NifX family protein